MKQNGALGIDANVAQDQCSGKVKLGECKGKIIGKFAEEDGVGAELAEADSAFSGDKNKAYLQYIKATTKEGRRKTTERRGGRGKKQMTKGDEMRWSQEKQYCSTCGGRQRRFAEASTAGPKVRGSGRGPLKISASGLCLGLCGLKQQNPRPSRCCFCDSRTNRARLSSHFPTPASTTQNRTIINFPLFQNHPRLRVLRYFVIACSSAATSLRVTVRPLSSCCVLFCRAERQLLGQRCSDVSFLPCSSLHKPLYKISIIQHNQSTQHNPSISDRGIGGFLSTQRLR